MLNPADVDDLEKRFTYHKPFGTQPQRYEALRAKAKELAAMIIISCPASREMSLALTKLEECSMWANASIARNETPPPKCTCGPTTACSNCAKAAFYSPTDGGAGYLREKPNA
jgi:hypothetical protein